MGSIIKRLMAWVPCHWSRIMLNNSRGVNQMGEKQNGVLHYLCSTPN
ncbi:hypothetical protein HMPREF0454_04909 [Hafnia alvei ATCC 51873]|uniref:Uncharacterized protein n=1 Tax=Hafnia alvei ATCC 51873 TaxID=1002364 RepID=G9YE60_HAFAL|nr:hypothetical protein HMPREF0454_04909 [Hafnia alvei ATCC 51873]